MDETSTPQTPTDVGLLRSVLLPSLALHTAFSATSYAGARATDRGEVKDWNWPTSQVAIAWISALGPRLRRLPPPLGWIIGGGGPGGGTAAANNINQQHAYEGLSNGIGHGLASEEAAGLGLTAAWNGLTGDQMLMLAGVSAWGIRLLYGIAGRTVRRSGDDSRYVQAKQQAKQQAAAAAAAEAGGSPAGAGDDDSGPFWRTAFWKAWLPEIGYLVVITLPFVLPFTRVAEEDLPGPLVTLEGGLRTGLRTAGVWLVGSGLALESVADWQLASYKQSQTDLCRSGVWDIVRHPNYLGDILVHSGLGLLSLVAWASASVSHAASPLVLLGPVANYVFLRHHGGDHESEQSAIERYSQNGDEKKLGQLLKRRSERNSVWPRPRDLGNWWVVGVAAVGAGAVGVQRLLMR